MRPSDAIAGKLKEVRAIIARYPFGNPRVFGSVARGEDDPGSDLDLLVDPAEGASYFDLAGLQLDLEALLGVRVDVFTPAEIRPTLAPAIYRDLRPLWPPRAIPAAPRTCCWATSLGGRTGLPTMSRR
jgi:hypothetical protein